MDRIAFFAALSIPVILLSRRSVIIPGSHGFYRFFALEGIVWLFASNIRVWFSNPFSLYQVVSWTFLCIAIVVVISGVMRLRKSGNAKQRENAEGLFRFEQTTVLVEKGIYRYIRHPLYSSLLFLCWGIFFKNPGAGLLCVSLVTSLFLYLTARADEKECISYFGPAYKEYMMRSKMFIPWIL